MHPIIRRLRGRVACYNELMRASAERHGSTVVDLWGMAPLADPRTWGRDRLHLTAEGHRRVALRVLETLGEPVADDWRTPLPGVRADPVARTGSGGPALDARVRDALRARAAAGAAAPATGSLPKRPELLPLDGGGRATI